MRSPVTQGTNPSSTPLKPTVPAGLPSLPSNMARSILENMVANRLRANLDQMSPTEADSSRKNPLNPLLPGTYPNFNALAPFHQNIQAAQLLAAQTATQAAAQAALQSSRTQAAAAQAATQMGTVNSNGQDGNLYQPAVKRRRRGYGSEVNI